jgi:hypothetical protein
VSRACAPRWSSRGAPRRASSEATRRRCWTISPDRRALVGAVDALGAGRDLTWLYLEPPSQVPELPAGAPAAAEHDPHDCALVAVSYRGGRRTARRLADAHPHLHRLRWHPEPVG